MTNALGSKDHRLFRHLDFKSIGESINDAPTKRSSVSERGLMI